MACKHAAVSFEAVLGTTLSPSVCSVIQVNKMVMCLESTREEKHLFHLQMFLHKPHTSPCTYSQAFKKY